MVFRQRRVLSIEELLAEPSRLARFARVAKVTLMLWGGLSLAALGGAAAYYYGGTDEEAAAGAPQQDHIAVLTEMPADLNQAGTFSQAPAKNPAPIVEARLPRPRPDVPVEADEPVTTGSITSTPYAPSSRRSFDPCLAFRQLAAPLRIHVRCTEPTFGRVRHRAPPPAPAPRPEIAQADESPVDASAPGGTASGTDSGPHAYHPPH